MGRIDRPIHGPTQDSEREEVHRPVSIGPQRTRDVLFGPASGLWLGLAGVMTAIVPATVPLLAPLGLAYGASVLARRARLPLRLPITAKRKDPNHPLPGRRRPRMAEGIVYLGSDATTGHELWIGNEDAREHISIPGVTGSGKSQALLGLVANALSMGSGCVIVDGKADALLPAQVYELARRPCRTSDIRNLSFITASGDKQTNTWNPFGTATADAAREMLLAQVEQNPLGGGGGDSNKVFFQRAQALLGAQTPAHIWMRDVKRIPFDINSIRFATELENISSVVFDRVWRHRDVRTGIVHEIPVPDMPEPIVYALRAYLGETPGYDPTLPAHKQKSDEPVKQHGFAKMHFGNTFEQMAGSLGHIFATGTSDIDLRDVILNRRILIVSLPAMENSGETTAALGKLVIAGIRSMMAQTLGGGRLEGDSADLIENRATNSDTPFLIVMDELAAFAGGGLNTLMQQGRSQGSCFALGWHDVEGMVAAIGQRAWTVLNNATLGVYMKQNAGGQTRQFIEGTVGEAPVTRMEGYDTRSGSVREGTHISVRDKSRIDWRDLRGLIQGEAVLVMGNSRVHARLFHTGIKGKGALRWNQPVPFEPDAASVKQHVAAEKAVLDALRNAGTNPESQCPPVLAAVFKGLRTADDAGLAWHEGAAAAVQAAGTVAEAKQQPLLATGGKVPTTDFTPTLEGTAAGPVTTGSPEDASTSAISAQTTAILAEIAKIAEAMGADPATAKQEAHRALAERDAARASIRLPEHEPMDGKAILALIDALLAELP